MNSHVTRGFRELFQALPSDVQERAQRAYRVLGTLQGDSITWYWVGKHEEYDRKLG